MRHSRVLVSFAASAAVSGCVLTAHPCWQNTTRQLAALHSEEADANGAAGQRSKQV